MATKKEETENAKKVFDENDETTCGFCSLQILDQDGLAKKQKGCAIEACWHLVPQEGDTVALEAHFPLNPLFYLQIQNEANVFLFGRFWLGDANWSRTNQIVTLIPTHGEAIHSQMGDGTEFVVQSEMPFLANAPQRLVPVRFVIKEQRFVTKVVAVRVEIPKASWTEYKNYRLKLWRASKVWPGADKDEKKDEKDEKKEDE